MKTTIKTLRGLQTKLKALGKLDEDTTKSIVCSLVGHSRIVSTCFGYVNCARCGDQIGDTLGGVCDLRSNVIVGHKCEACETNFKDCTWQDTYLTPDPFQ